MKSNDLIKVCICVAYDWYYLKKSLPIIYPYADSICISIDKDRISWSGNKFDINEEEFYRFIKEFDQQNKIILLEEDFHKPELKPIENECRQRFMMTEKSGEGGWFLQIDTDEYFLDFVGFVNYLKSLQPKRLVNVCCPWIVLFKKDAEGFYLIDSKKFSDLHFIPIATRVPKYDYGRVNSYFNIKTDYFILHESFSRGEDELIQKVNNWGHSHEIDRESFINRWKKLNSFNYNSKGYKNFHPMHPTSWPSLKLFEAGNITTLIDQVINNGGADLPKWKLKIENSVNFNRLKKLIKSF